MDRLPQLKSILGLPSPGGAAVYSPAEGDGQPPSVVAVTFEEPPSQADKETAETLDAFYNESRTVKAMIDDITWACNELQARHSENITTIDEDRSKQLRHEIEELSRRVAEKAKQAKDTLDVMSKKTAVLKETPASVQANSAVLRIEENQYAYLVLKLTTQMAEYQRQQSGNEDLYKARTQRQIKIKFTNPDGTQGIDDATAAQLAEQVMEDRMNSYVFQQSKEVLASVIETRNDIYRIEESMRNLNQLFSDLAFLVNEQGEVMDIVLANVQAAKRYVEAGRKELGRARKYQKKSRRKMLCMICIAGVVMVIFIVVIVLALKL